MSSTYNYTYDAIGQLTFGDSATASEDRRYVYDAAWNLNYRTNNATTYTFKVDTKNQLTNATLVGTQTYDGNGNVTYGAGNSVGYGYDDENQLANWYYYDGGYNGNGSPTSPADMRTEFVYDGRGRLRKRIEYDTDGTTWNVVSETRYVYDGMRVIQERNSGNTPTVSYTLGMDLSGSLEGAGGIGGFLGRSHGYSSGNWTSHNYYHADGNGNVTYLVNSSQTKAAEYRYDPYGNLISSSGSLAGANVYRFSSKELHANSSLYYYGYRWYHPNVQRWLNRDPIGEEGGINLYNYVYNDPVDWIDLWGLDSLKYDGSNLYHYDDNGNLLGTYPGTSGKDGCTDPCQKNKGPIPPGDYSLNPSEISSPGYFNARNWFADWGDFRVPLHPAPNTDTLGRDKFFLHGGKKPGSKGCIDIGNKDKVLFPKLQKSKSPVNLNVTYPPPPPFVMPPIDSGSRRNRIW